MPDLFPHAPKAVALDRQIECVEREIAMRRRVYPRRVEAGRMQQAKADDEIAIMDAVAATLRKLKAAAP